MEDWPPVGKSLILFGAILIVVGILFTFVDKIPFLGRLPGDIHIKKDHFSFYFPIATSVIVSVIVSLVMWLFRR